MKDKKKITILTTGIVLFVGLIIGATYAYFTITSQNEITNTAVSGKTGVMPIPTLNTTTPELSLEITPNMMLKSKAGTTYYATPEGKAVTENITYGNGRYILATASVTGEGINLECDYTLGIKAKVIDTTTNSEVEITDGSIEDVVVRIVDENGRSQVITLADIISGSKSTVAGKFYGLNNVVNQTITIEMYLINSTDAQDELSGKRFEIEISAINDGFTCYEDNMKSYAVYSETDNSLRFYKTTDVIEKGDTYNDLKVTEVYGDVENLQPSNMNNPTDWHQHKDEITSVVVEKSENSDNPLSPISLAGWFSNFINTSIIDLTNLNTSRVTNMQYLFYNTAGGYCEDSTYTIYHFCDYYGKNWISNVNDFEISGLDNFDTSKVQSFRQTFMNTGNGATSFTIGDLSNWNTLQATSTNQMFANAGAMSTQFTIDLSNWNVDNVTDMYGMFWRAGSKSEVWTVGNLSKWNTSKVTTMYGMFTYCGTNSQTFNLGNLSAWDTSNVTNMYGMFASPSTNKITEWYIGDISKWNVSSVTNMFDMFVYAGLNADYYLDLSQWDVSNVTSYNNFNKGVESKIIAPSFVATE